MERLWPENVLSFPFKYEFNAYVLYVFVFYEEWLIHERKTLHIGFSSQKLSLTEKGK